MGSAKQRDVEALLSRFDALDADGSGKLDHDDIAELMKAKRKQLASKARLKPQPRK